MRRIEEGTKAEVRARRPLKTYSMDGHGSTWWAQEERFPVTGDRENYTPKHHQLALHQKNRILGMISNERIRRKGRSGLRLGLGLIFLWDEGLP